MSKQPLIDQLDQAIDRILANPEIMPPSADPSITELLRIAQDLCHQPRPDFKATLKADLDAQRDSAQPEETKVNMSTSVSKVAQLRPMFRTLTPYLLPRTAEYVDFLKDVFHAKQTFRGDTGPNSFHAEFQIGNSMLMVGGGSSMSMPASMIIYVPNADETYGRALKAGAKSVAEIVENYGDRFGVVEDPAGNGWCIATYLGREPIVAQDRLNTITISFALPDAGRFVDFVTRAFNGREIVRYDSPEGKIMHVKIGIGDSAVGVGEANDRRHTKPTMIYMYVEDCDAIYQQAVRAGGKSILEPKDQPYGDRQAAVEDEWGNQWFIATPFRANYT